MNSNKRVSILAGVVASILGLILAFLLSYNTDMKPKIYSVDTLYDIPILRIGSGVRWKL